MAVIRNADGHCIDLTTDFVQHLAVILEFFGIGELLGLFVERTFVHVANGDDVGAAGGGIVAVAVPFAANADTLTFSLSGISKISALPQMKLAWAVTSGSDDLVTQAGARLEVIADTFLSLNTPVQIAAPALLDQRKVIQPMLFDRLRGNVAELDRQLSIVPSCERLHVEGGWYAVVRVPVTRTDEELAIELLRKQSLAVHPGHFYDFPGDGHLVLSLITEPAIFREGISRLMAGIDNEP